jgi:hypothetical protein
MASKKDTAEAVETVDIKSLNIYQKLHGVMQDWTTVLKGEKMVQNQYRFVSHDAVSAALHGHLVKWRLVAIPTVLGYKVDGNRTEVTLQVAMVNIDAPSETVITHAFGFGIDSQDKGPGKAVSYAFKYAVLKLFSLETTDDPDNDQAVKHEPSKVSSAPVATGAAPFQQFQPSGFAPFNNNGAKL